MKMKKLVAILCSMALVLSTMPIHGEVIIDGDIGDGDSCENPWAELSTTKADETTTPGEGETTTPGSIFDPGFDLTSLDYETITYDGTSALSLQYAIQSTTVEGVSPWYGDGGNTFQFAYTADAGDVSSVMINGQPAADDVVKETGAGLIKIDPTKLADDAYSVIVVTTNNGKFTAVIKKGNAVAPEVPTTSENDTTTPGGDTTTPGGDITTPGGDITTPGGDTTSPDATTAGGETTKDEETTTPYIPPFDLGGLTYNTIKCDGNESLTLDWAVPSTTVEGVSPWYGDGGNTLSLQFAATSGAVTNVIVNGASPAEGLVVEKNLGVVKINPTKLPDNAYSVIEVTTENGKFTAVIKKGNAVAPEVPTTSENDTTTPGGDTTTPGGDITTPGGDITTPGGDTTSPGGDVTTPGGDTTTPGGDITTAGGETTKDEETTTPYVPPFDLGGLTYNTIKCDGNESLTLDWAVQSSTIEGLTPWYGDGGNTLSLQFSADSGMVTNVIVNGASPAEGLVVEKNLGVVKINPTKLPDNAYSVIEVTTETGAFVFVVKRGTPPVIPTTPDQGEQTTPDQGNQTTPDQGNQTTPDQGNQTTPDQGNQTTPDQGNQTTPNQGGQTTTNQGGQTTTPSGNGNTTTVAPTTKAPAGNVSVAKAKVKKLKKTLASKKAKITLKKIAGAKYQVKVSTTKKFKKKKTVTKKKVKKVKFTIKSKKIAYKKVLYVKARAYKVVNGKTYYGKWSKIKKVKIKK